MSTEFVSLNEVFLPVTGGDIEGSLDVNGLLTINDKSGNGTVYDVADEIIALRAENEELRAALDSLSQKKKVLWDGTWDTGETITIPNITEYNNLIFVTSDWVLIPVSILPNNTSYARASTVYPGSSNDNVFIYSIQCKSDKLGSENWMIQDKNLLTISSSGTISNNLTPTFTIQRIYGVA